MEENFDLLAQSRANYYTAGCPVQFVRVELLKGEISGDIAVCLTFKNISEQPIAGLVIRFKCKNRAGEIICEDQFYYEKLTVKQGEPFGSDDAVYVSTEPVGSVEVEFDRMFLQNGRAVPLAAFKRSRLPGPRELPAELSAQLSQRTGKPDMKFVPQVIEQGWYCACGAFHPKEENTVYCSECGCDRILLQNALSGMLQQNRAPEKASAPEAARPVSETSAKTEEDGMTEQERFAAAYHKSKKDDATAVFDPISAEENAEDESGAEATRVIEPEELERNYGRADSREAKGGNAEEDYEDDYEEDYEGDGVDPDDEFAANIIRWAPPVTVILCALVIAFTVVYHLVAQ